jgi:hypothetical protein
MISRKAAIAILLLVVLSGSLIAQEPAPAPADSGSANKKLFGWKFSAAAGFNFSSTALSSNWTGQERNNWALSTFVDGTAEREFSMFVWKGKFNGEYGQTKSGSVPAVKSTDLVHTEAYLRWLMMERLNPYTDLTMDTQFDVLFKPVTLSQSLGIGVYLIQKPGQSLSTRAGLALKETYDPYQLLSRPLNVQIIQDTTGSENTRLYFGSTSVTNYELSLSGTVKLVSELRLFMPADFAWADMRCDNALYVKLSKYLNLKLSYLALYNYNHDYPTVWPRDIRTKFTTGLGISWAIF